MYGFINLHIGMIRGIIVPVRYKKNKYIHIYKEETMKGLSTEEVEHVADLANLVLTEEEKKNFSRQLNDILADIDKISSVEIEEGSEMLITPTSNHDLYHDDETIESLKIEEIEANANQTSGEYITVQKEKND